MSLFNQLGKFVANPGFQTLSTSDRPAYQSNLNQSIDDAWQKMSTLFYELGKSYYEQHMEDHQTEYEEQLSAIRDVHAELDQYQKLTDDVAARKRCPACGANLMEGAVFCSICGAKIPEVPIGMGEQKLCPQCHAVVDSDDAFCSICGTDLRNKNTKEVS